jgi:cytoskeletal protein CcmA (bactofilin family)
MKFIKNTNLRILAMCAIFNTGTLLAGGLIFSVTSALADGSTATQSVVGTDLIMPYDGYLMVDSAPLTGTKTIKFDLYQDATGGTAVWTETQTVNLYNGRFSVGLGSATSLTSTILDAEKLYLAMSIVETDAQGNPVEVELSGRQSIEPAPFAAWAANSADLNVDGALDVAGNAQVGSLGVTGAASAGSLSVTGTSTLTGVVSAKSDLNVDGNTQLGDTASQDKVQIYGLENDGATAALRIADGTTALLLDGNEIDSGNTLQLNVNSGNNVQVGGTLVVDGDVNLADDADIYDVDVINGYNDIRFRANSGDTSDDMKLTSAGHLEVYNNLEVDGAVTLGNNSSDTTTVKGSLTVEGGLNTWPEGNYCIIQSSTASCSNGSVPCSLDNSNCPAGFSSGFGAWDTDGNDGLTTSIVNGGTNVTVNGGNAGMQIFLCCK